MKRQSCYELLQSVNADGDKIAHHTMPIGRAQLVRPKLERFRLPVA